jgi:hypothetical protein
MVIRIVENGGDDVLVKEGLTLVVFFAGAIGDHVEAVGRAFEQWRAGVPAHALCYSMIGASASEVKRVTARTASGIKGQLDPIKAAKRALSSFVLQGPEEENSQYRFEMVGRSEPERKLNFVEVWWPHTGEAPADLEAAVALADALVEGVGASYAYLSRALQWDSDSAKMEAGEVIPALALRHPGFDVSSSFATAFFMGERVRGAYWVTYVATTLLEKLGGAEAVHASLAGAVEVSTVGETLRFRAGAAPEVGDVNAQQALVGEAAVALVLEPITFFGDSAIDVLFEDDESKQERWERRHLDD